jgi:hypothetical protein
MLGVTMLFLVGVFSFPATSFGVMSSTNYTIFADSIDAGGVLSASGSFSLEDTIGESPVDVASSSVYQIFGGYQFMDWGSITLDISASSVNLGDLTSAQVSTSSVILSVNTSASSGYVLSVGSVSGTSLTAVADGSVTAGQEEYGVALIGVDVAFADDRAVAGGLNLSSSSSPVTAAETTLIFKASIASSTATGARSQTVTLNASTNL